MVKNFIHILTGLLSIIFVVLFRVVFLLVALLMIACICVLAFAIVANWATGFDLTMQQTCIWSMLACMGILLATNTFGVGLADLIKVVNTIMGTAKTISGRRQSSMVGKGGVFKNG